MREETRVYLTGAANAAPAHTIIIVITELNGTNPTLEVK